MQRVFMYASVRGNMSTNSMLCKNKRQEHAKICKAQQDKMTRKQVYD